MGKNELTAHDWKRMVVPSWSEAMLTLVEDFSRDLIAMPAITLSADGTKIENSTLITCGTLFPDTGKVMQANKQWALMEHVKLHIDPIPMDKFVFQGRMVSELLDSTEIEFNLIPENMDSSLTDEMLHEQGVVGFSMRLFVIPTNGYLSKATLLIFSLPIEQMLDEYPSAACLQWPGLAFDRIEMDLDRTRHVLEKNHGQPICPAVSCPQPI